MNFTNPFFVTASIVLVALILIGIIVLLIMKKKKVSDQAKSYTIIAVVFAALILSGMLVYMVTTSMMYDLVGSKKYKKYSFENSAKTQELIIKEYDSADGTGFEIYSGDEKIGEIDTDKFLPFTNEQVQFEWKDDSVILYYTYQSTEDTYICKYCTIDLKNKSVSESSKSDKNLSENTQQSAESTN